MTKCRKMSYICPKSLRRQIFDTFWGSFRPFSLVHKRVVFEKGGFGGFFTRNENWNEGTFTKTTFLRNRPFVSARHLAGTFISQPCPTHARYKINGGLIFIHHQCWDVLPFCRFQRQRCIKILCPKDPDFYMPLALKTAKGQHLPALVVYKDQSPISLVAGMRWTGLPDKSTSQMSSGDKSQKNPRVRKIRVRNSACNLERCIDSMWMLTTALIGSRLQGHECKRKTAEWSIEHLPPCLACSIVLDRHCAQSILAYRQHRL